MEKWPLVPVHKGHWSRFQNQEQLLGTNASHGSRTNRDQWVSTWAGELRGGWIIGPSSWEKPGPVVPHVAAPETGAGWIIGPGSGHESGSLVSVPRQDFRAIFLPWQGFVPRQDFGLFFCHGRIFL